MHVPPRPPASTRHQGQDLSSASPSGLTGETGGRQIGSSTSLRGAQGESVASGGINTSLGPFGDVAEGSKKPSPEELRRLRLQRFGGGTS